MFLLALFLCLISASADTVAFLDGSYLKATLPETLSIEAYSALPSVLAGIPTDVSKDAGQELTTVIEEDIFNRPFITWTVVLLGVIKNEFFLDDVISMELSGESNGLGNPLYGSRSNCKGSCLVENFSRGMTTLGGSFSSSDGLLGKAEMETCGPSLNINNGALLLWATELGEIWNDVSILHSSRASINLPLNLHSVMTGLYLVRRTYGADSREFAFVSCVTRSALFAVRKDLEIYFNKGVFVSVLMHSTESDINDQALDEAVTMMGRQLLDVKWFSDSDPSTTIEQKAQRFSTNTVAYVMSLIIWFASLGSVYVLSNMDFTKDTLLYSQARID